MRRATLYGLCLALSLLAAPAATRADPGPGLPPGAPPALKDEVRRTYRVLVVDRRCYLASTVGVVVADCRDPGQPRYLGALALLDSVSSLALVNGRLAIANGPSGVVLAAPGDRPQRLGGVVLNGAAMGLAASGAPRGPADRGSKPESRLLVASGSAGLHLLDVSDPARPRTLDHWETTGYARDVIVSGDLVALADGGDGVHLFRLQGDRLRHLSSMQPPVAEAHAFALAFAGPQLLVADGPAGLLVLDVSQPERPRLLSRLRLRDTARGVAVQGHRAVVADGTAGVAVIDLKDPARPRETGRFKPERSANRVLLEGSLAYVANDYDGLLILRVPDQGDPVPLGRLPAPKPKRNVSSLATRPVDGRNLGW